MARKPKATPAATDPPTHEYTPPPVESVGARQFRRELKAISERGEPVIITRGRRSVSVFIPVDLPWYGDTKQLAVARSKLLKDARRASEALSRY